MSEHVQMVIGQKSKHSIAATLQNTADIHAILISCMEERRCRVTHILLPNPEAASDPFRYHFGNVLLAVKAGTRRHEFTALEDLYLLFIIRTVPALLEALEREGWP